MNDGNKLNKLYTIMMQIYVCAVCMVSFKIYSTKPCLTEELSLSQDKGYL